MSDDDQIWLDSLAGRVRTPSASSREALALRAALRVASQDAPPRNVTAMHDKAREEALIARAVRDGVISASKSHRRMNWQLPLAASVLIIVAGGILTRLNAPLGTPVVRGDEAGIVRLNVDDPAALRQYILYELRAAGVSATGYETLGVQGIDADLKLPLPPEVRRVLAAHGIPEPADGVLRIEIRSSE